MYRHPFDAVSFFFGLVFTAGAVSSLLVDEAWPFGRGRLWPILLIAGGLAMLIASLRPARDRRPGTVATSTGTSGAAAPDPVLFAAHREVAEYVGDAVPATGDSTATHIAATPEAGPVLKERTAEAEGSPDEETPAAP